MIRLLHAAGVCELPRIPTAPLSAGATDIMQRVLKGFVLLKRCRYPHDGNAPAPYTRSFASAWCGISEWQAGEAIRRLVDAGLLRQAGSYGRMPLFAIGGEELS
jgi:hypothetical protein